jgi:Tol biopolymer transport system component
MKRSFVVLIAVVLLAACSDATSPRSPDSPEPTTTDAPAAPAGQIAFSRGTSIMAGDEEKVVYTVNPDGSDLQPLFEDGPSSRPRWSPDGTEIHIFCCGDGMAAHILDPDTGDLRTLPQPDPKVETFCGGSWSPDGKRLTCAGFGVDDPSRNGIYSIRSSDGGGLKRITSNPGGFDAAGDYSPDGERLVFIRFKDERPVGFFVTNVDGSGLQQLTPEDMILDDSGFAGSWSPTGYQILIVALASEDAHKAIWVVNADGSSPHQLPITPACGGPFSDPTSAGCYSPSWSPDGSKIAFTRSSPDGNEENIYTVNADGSGLFPVTDGGGDDDPDWGPTPR